MLIVFTTLNGIHMMGLQDCNDHATLMRIKDPLIFRYCLKVGEEHTGIEFSSYDNIANPREARIRVDVMYKANEFQTKEYEKAVKQIFGESYVK